MKIRIVALFLVLVSLLSLLSLTGCDNQDPDKTNNENEQTQNPPLGLVVISSCSEELMQKYRAIYEETGCNPVVDASNYSPEEKVYTNVTINYFYAAGFSTYRILSAEEYEDIQRYQNETGKQVIYPTVKINCRDTVNRSDNTIAEKDINDANIYYLTEIKSGKSKAVLTSEGNFIPNYWKLAEGEKSGTAATYNSLRIEGENGFEEDGKQYFYVYGRKTSYGIEVRLFLYEYYQYLKTVRPDSMISEEDLFKFYN